jgi:gluconate 5-dehydrogenase
MILKGKTALVSGGSRGIGYAIAKLYHDEGANVYIMSRNADKLGAAAEKIGGDERIHAVPCDVSSKTAVDQAFERIKADGARIDILVNDAGVNLRGPLETMPLETWQKVLDINLTGTFLLTQKVFPDMKEAGGGKIVNIASLMSEVARPTIAPYVASKGGVKMFTRAIAVEWAKYNIQANAIIPGYIETEMNAPLIADKEFNAKIVGRTPAARWGKPEEVAQAALFLASKGADFITGQALAVDGGILANLM